MFLSPSNPNKAHAGRRQLFARVRVCQGYVSVHWALVCGLPRVTRPPLLAPSTARSGIPKVPILAIVLLLAYTQTYQSPALHTIVRPRSLGVSPYDDEVSHISGSSSM